jgi:ABC-type antimicrobial peptide transport system permease subunit
LGASRSDVLRLVVIDGLKLTVLGLGLGIAGAIPTTRLISSFLYGVVPHDVAVFVGVTTLLTGVALVASYIPARRAASSDPMNALRHE